MLSMISHCYKLVELHILSKSLLLLSISCAIQPVIGIDVPYVTSARMYALHATVDSNAFYQLDYNKYCYIDWELLFLVYNDATVDIVLVYDERRPMQI